MAELDDPLAGIVEVAGQARPVSSGSLDRGIARSRFGLVVLSKPFFAKGWPQYELDGLVTMANSAKQILLPIWHEISKDEVIAQSPSLADKVALRTSDLAIDEMANEIAAVIFDQRLPD